MAVNLDKPQRWKADIAASVDFYNGWFMRFAPKAYRDTRVETTNQVKQTLKITDNLANIGPQILAKNPAILSILRMTTAPPIARDRLIGLAGVAPNLVRSLELKQCLPPRMPKVQIERELEKIGQVIKQLLDEDIFSWVTHHHSQKPSETEVHRAATIVSDRVCGAVSDPIIRNAQEQRQLAAIQDWLEKRGYVLVNDKFDALPAGTFSFRCNVTVTQASQGKSNQINMPIDVVIKPRQAQPDAFPLLVEAKSAGDFANTNKRRKEEAIKMTQLKNSYGDKVRFILFLCGYFDSGYLGYEAAEGIDWVWEHRIDDLAEFGL